jgi:Spy/CpxP family protein refolding chaperone
MKKNLIIVILILLIIVNVAALVTIAYHRFHPKRHFPPADRLDMHRDFIKQELGLSGKQAKEFKAHFERGRKETEPILDSLEVKRAELMEEISADEPSRDKLDKLAEEIGALQDTLQRKMILHLLEGKSLLTPEQQKRFFSLFKEERGQMRGWRDREGGIGRRPGHPNFEEGK